MKQALLSQELHCGSHSKSHSPQCLQCHVDFEAFSQSHTSFTFNSISIKSAFRQHENTEFYPHNYISYILNDIVMVIVKSEWLNLRSLVTAIAAFPALEYLYHSIILAIAGNND